MMSPEESFLYETAAAHGVVDQCRQRFGGRELSGNERLLILDSVVSPHHYRHPSGGQAINTSPPVSPPHPPVVEHLHARVNERPEFRHSRENPHRLPQAIQSPRQYREAAIRTRPLRAVL